MSPFSAFGHFVTLETRWLVGFDLNTNFTLPTGALDSHSSRDLLSSLKAANDSGKATILMVTHDAYTASYAKQVYFLSDGQIQCRLNNKEDRKLFYDEILKLLASMGGERE